MLELFLKYRDKGAEKYEEIIEKFRGYWLTLNPREKIILTSLASLMTVLVVLLVVKETVGLFSRVSSQAEINLRNIERIQTLARDIRQQQNDLMKYESLKNKRGDAFKFQDYVHNEVSRQMMTLIKSAPAKIVSANEKDMKNKEFLEVQVKDATLDSTLRFLQSIEDTLGLRILELAIKPDFEGPSKLEMTAVISNQKDL